MKNKTTATPTIAICVANSPYPDRRTGDMAWIDGGTFDEMLNSVRGLAQRRWDAVARYWVISSESFEQLRNQWHVTSNVPSYNN